MASNTATPRPNVPASAGIGNPVDIGEAEGSPTLVPLSPPFRQILQEGENCWCVTLPQSLSADADDNEDNRRSPWRLLEDGTPIGQPHAGHRRIGQVGHGSYSHWRTQRPATESGYAAAVLYFSTSDNSDPNFNGRRYALARSGASEADVGATATVAPGPREPSVAVPPDTGPPAAAPAFSVASPPRPVTLAGTRDSGLEPGRRQLLDALPYVCNSTDILVFRARNVRWDAIIPEFVARSKLVSSFPVLERFPSAGEIDVELPLPAVSYEGIVFPSEGAYNLLTQFGVFRILILPPVASAADVVAIGRFFSANVVHSGFNVADCTDARHVASSIYYPNLLHKLFRSDQPLGLICGQASMALCALYHHLGFPTRQVHFHGAIRGGHFSTEVFDGERWVIVDPDFDCVVYDEADQLVDADAIARALLLGEDDRLRVVSLSQKRWLKPSRAFLWGFYGHYSWRPDDTGPSRCCDSYFSQLKGMVVRRRDCSFHDGVLTLNWVKLAAEHADEPNTNLPIAEQIDRQRTQIAGTRELAGLYEAAITKLDVARNQELIYRYGTCAGFDGPLKYLDCAYWLRQKLQILVALGLHESPPLRILDIGTGGGHFPFLCALLGHDVVGIDLDVPVYQDICAMLGVRRVSHRVERGRTLPDLGGAFDLITAFAAQFDYVGPGEFWSTQDWRDFIESLLATQIRAPGRIHFSLNTVWDAESRSWRFKQHVGAVFQEYGGRADPDRSVVELDVGDELIRAIRDRNAVRAGRSGPGAIDSRS